MIFDNIRNCEIYYGVNSKFEKAFKFIKKAIEEKAEVGKYEIDGDEIYAFVQSYESRLKEGCIFEGHKKYIDIQYVIEGREMLGVIDISKSEIKDEYKEEHDAAFYSRNDASSYCIAKEGDFCIFYPHDIHSPGVACNNVPSNVKKIVVKVRV